ncbi:erythromycin esterase-like protein [Metabacillus crassostreae]|uniref:erythromycin esterase family protein n=1 Tax=Metabacillus crassostreae TaxID=929098 RepID=UPI00195A5676|nr:erythromycin esterase family protein [Metabacillus crassostreae]MBM7602420.1 erythromycin esterase-like protein [Metabacillus crassostreae]
MDFGREGTWSHWKDQIREIAGEINNDSDFSIIDRYIKNNRILLLGESSHGIGDFYTTKIDLIRYLHEQHGFNVVVLESSFIEATLCKRFLKDQPTKLQIQNCFLDIFHNEEMIPLFNENWARSIKLSGMDPQPTYPLISDYIIDWIRHYTNNELYRKIKEAEKAFFELDKQIMFKITKSLKVKMKSLIKEYQILLDLINKKRQICTKQEERKIIGIIQQGMQNRMDWLRLNLKEYLSSGIKRDLYMFENVEWLMNHYFKNEKLIIWAHNFHIRRKQTLSSRILGIKTVGNLLYEKYPEEVYSIGMYAGKGKFSTQLRVELEIDSSRKNHLESLLSEASTTNLFLPLDVENQPVYKKMWYRRRW